MDEKTMLSLLKELDQKEIFERYEKCSERYSLLHQKS